MQLAGDNKEWERNSMKTRLWAVRLLQSSFCDDVSTTGPKRVFFSNEKRSRADILFIHYCILSWYDVLTASMIAFQSCFLLLLRVINHGINGTV